LVVDNRNLVRFLKDQHCKILLDVRYRFGPTLVGRAWKRDPVSRELTEILYDFRCSLVQDRIGVVPDQLVVVAHTVAPRSVCQRSWTRCQRLEAGKRRMPPHSRKIWDRRNAISRSSGWRHSLPPHGHYHCWQNHQYKENPVLRHHGIPAHDR
jgi:hypothetical protein